VTDDRFADVSRIVNLRKAPDVPPKRGPRALAIEDPVHGPMLTSEAVALLVDLPVEEVRAELHRQHTSETGLFQMPEEWLARARVVRERIGTDDMAEALAILGIKAGVL
jgi:hypothetical protein